MNVFDIIAILVCGLFGALVGTFIGLALTSTKEQEEDSKNT